LGAFFNAVFLIALCLSIVLEAITRLIDPPEISNPMLILIVGSLGLASNLAGFLVLGGHGHSHGPEAHGDETRSAEEGHNHQGADHDDHRSICADDDDSHEEGSSCGDVFPEAVVAKANKGRASKSPRKHNRRTSRGLKSIDDMPIHPASFRNDIISSSRPQLDGIESEDNTASEGDAAVDDEAAQTEHTPLLTKSNDESKKKMHQHSSENSDPHSQHLKSNPDSSLRTENNHNKPKKESKGGHSHSHDDMGMNAMILHVIGDALGNVGVIVSALVIWLTTSPYRFYADPAVSLFITLIILKSCIPLTAATAKILLQATPDHIDVNEIKKEIKKIPGIVNCHHVHIWQLSDTQIVASMHIQVAFPISEANGERYMTVAKSARRSLHAKGIHSATLQPEFCLDEDHDHSKLGGVGLDGIVGQTPCRLDDDCLLECVDDCEAGGCCSPAVVEAQHTHSENDGHSHSH
jgi:zinc transporter 1